MKLRILIPFVLVVAVILASSNMWISWQLDLHLKKIEETESNQFETYRLADQLRHTSDDLTRFARKYVQTGNPEFEDNFNQILAIRDGKLPRPDQYDGIYWDLVLVERLPNPASPKNKAQSVSLKELVRRAKVTNAEYSLISRALERSDELAQIEKLAFDAMKGNYVDPVSGKKIENSPNIDLARKLLYGNEYLQAKADIMQPIADAVDSITLRTHKILKTLEKEEKELLKWEFTIALGSLLIIIYLTTLLYYRILNPVGKLANASNKIYRGDLNARSNVSGSDELGILGETFDHMVEQLSQSMEELAQEKKEVETKNLQLHKESEIKNKFIGMAAHDLRNPLSSIRGFAEIILENPGLTKSQKEFLKLIKNTSSSMLEMVNELLDVSVIENGGLKIKPVATSLKNILEEHLKVLSPTANAKQIELDVNIEDECQCYVDPDRIGQVIDNLVSNALKFSHTKTTVKITLIKETPYVKFIITDEGPGLTDDDKKKMFGDFQRLSAKPTGNESSTGLGLSIVKRIITSHGGNIKVESVHGEGCTFIVEIPDNFKETSSVSMS